MGFLDLFRKKEDVYIEGLVRKIRNCALYHGRFKKEGDFYIFQDRLVFEPYNTKPGVVLSNIGMAIGTVLATALINKAMGDESGNKTGLAYANIARLERCKAMGVNCCMKVITKDNSEMVFSFWPVRKELDEIIAMLNQQVAHYQSFPPAFLPRRT